MATPQQQPQFQGEYQVARQFIEAYYNMFDTNRSSIVMFFRDASTISFEGSTFTGGQSFLTKLQQMGVPVKCAHRIVTLNAQPSQAGSRAILVFVTGEFLNQQYAEVFQLVPENQTFYVHNNIFRVGNTNGFNVPQAASDIAKSFVQFYYDKYDTDRIALTSLFRPASVLSFEEAICVGPPAAMEKLTSLPPVRHDLPSLTCDVQQVNGNSILLIFITGRLSIDEANPLNFSETFLLVLEGQTYVIGNDIFRLKYG